MVGLSRLHGPAAQWLPVASEERTATQFLPRQRPLPFLCQEVARSDLLKLQQRPETLRSLAELSGSESPVASRSRRGRAIRSSSHRPRPAPRRMSLRESPAAGSAACASFHALWRGRSALPVAQWRSSARHRNAALGGSVVLRFWWSSYPSETFRCKSKASRSGCAAWSHSLAA